MIDAVDIHVKGIVQGVGFRPFVYRMAKKYLINGWVLNAADGVYTASVDGLHDKIEVSITVAGGKIENIEITGGRDSMLITDEQLAEYVGAIIASQSADVDIVSGATVDCQAIGTAIGQAFAK